MSRLGEADSFANQPVVIDNGSGLLKAGFAGAEMPKVIFPSYVGRPKHVRVMAGAAEGDVFVGDAARELRGLLKLNYPTKHGVTTDWEDMHHVWQHCFSELGVVVDQHPVLLTEAALNPAGQRGKAAELFFETFGVPAFYVETQAILALYASGRTTGVVLDSGDGVSVAVPVVEGFVIPHAVNRIDVAGRDITQYLQRLLRRAGHHFHTSAELEVVKDIKEKICYVAYNIDAHDKDDADDVEPEVPYKLPDGSVLSVSSEKYRAPELLFHPSLCGSEEQGVHAMLCQSIARCDLDVRRSLFSSIILSGGSTLFDGFGDRLLSECRRLAPRDTKIKIWAPPERILSTWIGGSILASLATFKRMWVTRKDYDEHGKSIMHRRGLG